MKTMHGFLVSLVNRRQRCVRMGLYIGIIRMPSRMESEFKL